MRIRGTIPEAVPVEHVEAVMRCARRVRRDFTEGRSWRHCLSGALGLVGEIGSDPRALRIGIVARLAGGDFDERCAHSWAEVQHPAWPEPLILDVTLDQFDMWSTGMRFRSPRRYPAIFLGTYGGTPYHLLKGAHDGQA